MTKLRYIAGFLLVVLALAGGYVFVSSRARSGVVHVRPNETAEMKRKDEEPKIVGAVLCYQLKQQQEATKGKVVFLFTDDKKDPSDSFLAQVRCEGYNVRKQSQSTRDAKGVKDKTTGEEGLIFGVTSIKWVKETEVEVTSTIHFDRENNFDYLLRVVNEESGKWVVKEAKLTAIT